MWMIHKIHPQWKPFPSSVGSNAGLRRLVLGSWNTNASRHTVHVGTITAPPDRHDSYIVPTEKHAWINTLLYLDADTRFLILSRPWNCTDAVGGNLFQPRHMVCIRHDRAAAPLTPAMHAPPAPVPAHCTAEQAS